VIAERRRDGSNIVHATPRGSWQVELPPQATGR